MRSTTKTTATKASSSKKSAAATKGHHVTHPSWVDMIKVGDHYSLGLYRAPLGTALATCSPSIPLSRLCLVAGCGEIRASDPRSVPLHYFIPSNLSPRVSLFVSGY